MPNIVARYTNASGAEITVTTEKEPRNQWTYAHWTCQGCHSTETGGLIDLEKATKQANKHARACIALPPQK